MASKTKTTATGNPTVPTSIRRMSSKAAQIRALYRLGYTCYRISKMLGTVSVQHAQNTVDRPSPQNNWDPVKEKAKNKAKRR